MNRLLLIFLGVVVLSACMPTYTYKQEKTIAASRGDCYEELILLERADGTDTLCHLHLPLDDSPATVRLHPKFNVYAGAQINGKDADHFSFNTNYSGVDNGVRAQRFYKGGFSAQRPTVGHYQSGNSWNTSQAVTFAWNADKWQAIDLQWDEDDVKFLYQVLDEELGVFEDNGTFVFQQVMSTPGESTIYTSRIVAH